MNAVALIDTSKSLDEIADEINALAHKAADYRLRQALLLRQANREIVYDLAIDSDERRVRWREWTATLSIGKHEVNKLLKIAYSNDPAAALAAQREKDRLAGQKHREGKQDLRKSRSADLALKGFRQHLPKGLPIKDRDKLARKTLRSLGYRNPEDLVAERWSIDVSAVHERMRVEETDPIKAFRNVFCTWSKAKREVFIRQLIEDFLVAVEVPVYVELVELVEVVEAERAVIDCPF